MAYESPISIIERITRSATEEVENTITRTVSLYLDVKVDKEELKKALDYDRQQYDKGYKDALAEIREKIENVKTEIKHTDFDMLDYYDNTDTIREMVLNVIDKHLGE